MVEYEECQNCAGWCCLAYIFPCGLSDEDIERIAAHLEIPLAEFKEIYVVTAKSGLRFWRQSRPCVFWTLGQCGIHAVKPQGCASFPPYGKGLNKIKRNCARYFKKEALATRECYAWQIAEQL